MKSCMVKALRKASLHPELEPYCMAVYAFMSPIEKGLDQIRAVLHLKAHRREMELECQEM